MNYELTCTMVRETIVAGSRLNFERDGVVSPMSFIVAKRNPDTGAALDPPALLMIPMIEHMGDKDRMRRIQQELCDTCDAVAHAFVSESWLVSLDHLDDDDATVPLADHPQRKEVIAIALEHESGGVATWLIPIIRDENGATLGETSETSTPWDGRMSGYLKAVRDRKVQA